MALTGTIEIRGIADVMAKVKGAAKIVPNITPDVLERCGFLAQREAIANAPRSPTNEQYSATLKRKQRTARKMYPGGLEKSIEHAVLFDTCFVFVAENSYAGRYAARIHDEKGITWRNRGPGTIAKGRRADEKFIERAVFDNQENFKRIFEDELKKEIDRL